MLGTPVIPAFLILSIHPCVGRCGWCFASYVVIRRRTFIARCPFARLLPLLAASGCSKRALAGARRPWLWESHPPFVRVVWNGAPRPSVLSTCCTAVLLAAGELRAEFAPSLPPASFVCPSPAQSQAVPAFSPPSVLPIQPPLASSPFSLATPRQAFPLDPFRVAASTRGFLSLAFRYTVHRHVSAVLPLAHSTRHPSFPLPPLVLPPFLPAFLFPPFLFSPSGPSALASALLLSSPSNPLPATPLNRTRFELRPRPNG